ncbi:hypothetical protein [Saccharopolyspora sp. NPDC049426]
MSELHNGGHPSPWPAFDVNLTCRVGSTTRGSDELHAAAPDSASVRQW